MERLISSSSSLSSRSCIPNRHFIPPGARPSLRCGLPIFRSLGFKQAASFFSRCGEQHPTPLTLASRSLFCLRDYAAPQSEEESELSSPSTRSAAGRDLEGPLLRKVASIALSVVISSAIVTLFQTILARPVYATVAQAAAQTGGSVIRTEFLTSAWTGFFAGCLHTLSGPDHLAALAPLSIGRTKIESAIVGALWGCGHDAGQMIFGLIFLLLKDRLHIEIIRTWGTRVVGITLLIIGAMGIREASEVSTACIENGESDVSITASGGRKKIGLATFATGIVHGLQPDALVMVLPALALPSRLAGAAFLGMFLVGTVFAMGTYTVFIGSCSQALKDRVPRITEKLTWAASLLAIFMGISIIISQLFGFSLY